MQHDSQTSPGYSVLIGTEGGPVHSRIIGSIPRRLRRNERARLLQTLALGGTIEVVAVSRDAAMASAASAIAQLRLLRK